MDSLENFADGMAHDFNNIFVGIMGYIDMLNCESEGFTEAQKEYLKNAGIGCERAADLINRFQALSGRTVSEKAIIDTHIVAREALNLLGENTDEIIEKRLDIKQGEFFILANPAYLKQVFLNLGTNAVQALEAGRFKKDGYINITAKDYKPGRDDRTGLPEGEYVHILFEDNGTGMSDDVRRRAFDPMFTTNDNGKKQGKGLGLAMVYDIITRIHHGDINIESEEGKGTTFHIYIPKVKPDEYSKTEEDIAVEGGSETILVVDDEKAILRLIRIILEKYGYNIRTACDGVEAMEIYRRNKDSIDAVILDLTMPRMSGRAVFEKMLEINPEVKVIISSGHCEEDRRKGILLAVKEYVKKPYKLTDLAQTVRRVLDL